MTKLQMNNLLERAGWTALQAFLGAFITLAPGILSAPNLTSARALGVAAIVAGLGAAASALKTLIITYRS